MVVKEEDLTVVLVAVVSEALTECHYHSCVFYVSPIQEVHQEQAEEVVVVVRLTVEVVVVRLAVAVAVPRQEEEAVVAARQAADLPVEEGVEDLLAETVR